MKQTTKRILGIAIASTLVIGVASGVFARGGFGPGWGGHRGMMGGYGGMMGGPGAMMGGYGGMMNSDPVAYTDRRLTELKTTLDITADQETVWKSYSDAIKGSAGLMLAHRTTMHSSQQIEPEQRFTLHEEGLQQMQTVTTAGRDLFQVLTPEQKDRAGNLIGMH